MAKARIEIVGDSSSYQRSVKEAALVTDRLGLDMKKLSVTARSSAEAQVAASVRKTARLRGEVTEYKRIAAAAEKGSKEQIIASNLAARSERNLAASIGVTARESRAFSTHGVRAERDLSRAARGAAAGSGIFRGLGRSIAFASGGFLAFASAGQFIRTSIDAAKEAQVTQRQLAAQFKASGRDLRLYQGAIEKTTNRLSALSGFTNDELKSGFVTIFRTTSNVSKSLKDLSLAADIARAKHISLAQASLVVAKTEAGNTSLLRRQGFAIGKHVTAQEALAKVTRAVAGQALAGSTAQERFGAVLHNSEEIIGTALLPTLNKYLTSGAKWLTQMNESGRLEKDVATATHTIGDAFKAARALMQPLLAGFRLLSRLSGGTRHALELLGTTFLALELRAKLLKWGVLSTGIRSVGTSAVIAEGEVAGLSGAIGSLAAIAPIVVPIVLVKRYIDDFKKAKAHGRSFIASALTAGSKAGGIFEAGFPGLKAVDDAIKTGLNLTAPKAKPTPAKLLPFPLQPFRPGQKIPTKAAAAAAAPRPISLAGQFNLAELRLAQAQLTTTSADDRRILSTEAAIVRIQLQHTKTLKDRIELTQKLAGIVGQIQGIDQADAAAAKEAAKAAKERRQAALQAKEFKVLGLDPTGQAFSPGLRALRRELGNVRGKIKGTNLDTSKNKGLLGNVTKLLFGKDAHSLTKDVRDTVKQMLDALNDSLKNASGPETRFKQANTKKLLAGLGLSPAQMKAARARLSQLGAGGTVPGAGVSAFGYVVPAGDNVIHTTVKLDNRTIAVSTTRQQQKTRRRNPPQKRGPHSGGGI